MRLACVPARRQRQCRSTETVSVRRDRAGPCGPAGLSYTIFPMLIKGLYHRSGTERFHISPFHGFPDMFRLRDYAMVVPPRPARASFAISMEVMMAWRPFPAFMKSMEASILGSMEPAENWPSFA